MIWSRCCFFTFFASNIFTLTLGLLYADVSDHRMSQGLKICMSKRFIQMTCRAGRGLCTWIMQNKHQTNVNYFHSEYQPFIPGPEFMTDIQKNLAFSFMLEIECKFLKRKILLVKY